ncbi:hypothetical protein R2F25_38525 [Streptomyces sp. UP1A-1]|nr:hypothetical protein [Streptomyces sp. UP1A-1]
MTTAPTVGKNRLLQLCARIRIEGGVWDGKRTHDFYLANGFNCDLSRARTNLEMAAEQFPQLLTKLEGERWTYQVPDNVSVYFPEGALEQIEDNRAFIAFARERLTEAMRGQISDGERRLLDGVKNTLVDYEAQHEAAALSHALNDDTGAVEGLRWALENLLFARFKDHPA